MTYYTDEGVHRDAAVRKAVRNPSAFPHPHSQQQSGMTLRDYFAGQCMQALLTRGDDTNRPAIAEWAYMMADAMLKERA
jgi:hypothetical protein